MKPWQRRTRRIAGYVALALLVDLIAKTWAAWSVGAPLYVVWRDFP